MKTKNLILRVLTIVFSGLMVIPMVVGFVTATTKTSHGTTTEAVKLSDLTDNFFKVFNKSEAMMTIAKILFYVTFALAMLLVVLEVVRFVVKSNSLVDGLTKLCSLLVLILGVLTFVFALIWCLANKIELLNITFFPWAGGVLTLVFGVVAGLCGLADANTKTKKKK